MVVVEEKKEETDEIGGTKIHHDLWEYHPICSGTYFRLMGSKGREDNSRRLLTCSKCMHPKILKRGKSDGGNFW